MSIKIEKYTKERIDDVIDFEKELRVQEPNTYFWNIDDNYIENVKRSFDDGRFNESAISLLAYQEEKVVGRIDASFIYTHLQALLQALEEVLKAKNIETLIILTAGNEEATKFYDACENMEFCRGAMLKI